MTWAPSSSAMRSADSARRRICHGRAASIYGGIQRGAEKHHRQVRARSLTAGIEVSDMNFQFPKSRVRYATVSRASSRTITASTSARRGRRSEHGYQPRTTGTASPSWAGCPFRSPRSTAVLAVAPVDVMLVMEATGQGPGARALPGDGAVVRRASGQRRQRAAPVRVYSKNHRWQLPGGLCLPRAPESL